MTPHPFKTESDNFPAAVRVGRISYMNVAPIYYGLNNGGRPDWMDVTAGPPAMLNKLLAEEKLDISPVSSAAYARHQDRWMLLPDLSISCFGRVMSVLLVSRFPLEKLEGKRVILTRESATAAALSRYLFASRNIRPRIETGHIRCARDLHEDAGAALVIGDAALKEKWHHCFPHVWDLGEMWKQQTGLPFVFALWAVRRSFADAHPDWVCAVIRQFQRSLRKGEVNICSILPEASEKLGISQKMCRQYYDRLCYDLGPLQKHGAAQFFQGLYAERIISKPVNLTFFERYDGYRKEAAA